MSEGSEEGDDIQQTKICDEGQDIEEHIAAGEQPKQTFKSPQTQPHKRKRATVVDRTQDPAEIHKCMKQASSALGKAMGRLSAPENVPDDCALYGQLLASKLRAVEPRTRAIIMNKIDNLLFNLIHMGGVPSLYSTYNLQSHSQPCTQPASSYPAASDHHQFHNSSTDIGAGPTTRSPYPPQSPQSPASTASTHSIHSP
jgi:hypothetical protein